MLKYNVLISLISAYSLMAPDYIMRFFRPSVELPLHRTFLLYIFLLCLGLSFCRRLIVINTFLLVLFVLTAVEVLHLSYFGCFLMPDDVMKIVSEKGDILETACAEFSRLYYVLFILIPPYLGILFLYNQYSKKMRKVPYLSAAYPILFLLLPLRGYWNDQRSYLYPLEVRSSLQNGLNAVSSLSESYLKQDLYQHVNQQYFKPYEIVKRSTGIAQNIVLIIGESCRFDHLSLYGYERKTTPLLDELAQKDSRFIYKKGLSTAASTEIFFSIFFNIIREPGMTRHLLEKNANLLRLAKEQGYKTFWVSLQDGGLLREVPVTSLDYIVTWESNNVWETRQEEQLIEQFNQLDLSEKNFIVLHQRAVHSPFENCYSHRPDHKIFPENEGGRRERMINTYDNAVHYNDEILTNLFKAIENRFHDKAYVFFTSDHGELLGENDMYGHGPLIPLIAHVPIFFYNLPGDEEVAQFFAQKSWIHHYDLSVLIADLIGVDVKNSQAEPDKYYLHGGNIYGDNAFMEIKISGDKAIVGPEIKNVFSFFSNKNHD